MASTSIAVKILGDAKGFQKALGEAGGALSGFGKRIGKIGGAVALAGGAAIGASVVKGVTSALDRADLQTALANNLGLTAAQSEAAGAAAAAAYGEGFGASFEENANIAATLANLGVKTTEALTEQTRQATAITETFAVDQAELLASTSALIERGFVANTAEAFDLLAESAQGSFIPLSEQLDLLNEYGDQIAQVGLTGEEAFGLISGAASSFEADKILDTFKELAIRGQDMSTTSVAALEGLGLNAEEVARAFGTGGAAAAQARDDILRAMSEIEDPIERNAAGVALMGTAFEDLGLNPLDKLTADLEVSGDAAEALADKSLTVRDRFAALGRRGENALARLGEALLPFVEQAMPSLEAGLNRGIELFERHMPTAIRVVQNVLAGLQPVFAAVLDAVGAVFAWFQTNWPAIRDVVLSVFNEISDWVAENWPAIQVVIVEVMQTIGAIITEVVALVQAVWQRWGDEILLVVETVFRVLAPIIQNALNLVLAVIRTVTALIKGDWDAVWNGIKAIVSTTWNLIKSIVSGALTALRTSIRIGLNAVKAIFGNIWDGIVRFLERLPGRFVKAFGKAGQILLDVGRQIMNGLWDGLKAVWRNVSSWVSDKVGEIKNKFTSGFGILSPSTVTREYGQNIMEGLRLGLVDNEAAVDSNVTEFVKRLQDRFKGLQDLSVRQIASVAATRSGPVSSPAFVQLNKLDEQRRMAVVKAAADLQRQAAIAAANRAKETARESARRQRALLDRQRPTVSIQQVTVHDGRDLFDEIDRRAYLAGPR